MKKTKRQNGITLVALVITIIILLILATISVQSLTNTGLFSKAKEAKEKSQNAEENQAKTLNEYEDELNKYISGTVEENKDPIREIANKVLSTTDNTELQDSYGNKIVVPAGFKIVLDDTTNNAVTVDKGIVIEDVTSAETAGSQFVWIPVGTIYTDSEHTEVKKKTIELNRYTFDTNGNPTAQGENVIETYYSEKTSKGNTITKKENALAKSIANFKTSVANNGGYYIGRYEARQKSEKIIVNKNDNVWNSITQPNASEQSKNMYDTTHPFTSDLTNSYAWDTAILFLQTCGVNDKYSMQTSSNSSLSTTGTTDDVQCNVYDMASNVLEWTTETSSYSGFLGVARGGNYLNSVDPSRRRVYENALAINDCYGFRPILYLNV